MTGIHTPVEKEWARSVYWMYVIVLEEQFPLSRDELIAALGSMMESAPAPTSAR